MSYNIRASFTEYHFFIIVEVAVYVLAMSLANSSSLLPENSSVQGYQISEFLQRLFKLECLGRTWFNWKIYPFLESGESGWGK